MQKPKKTSPQNLITMPFTVKRIQSIRRMSEIKTAILGGSFDPVHLGHLFLLNTVVENTDYRRFILVPAHLSNFKQDSKPLASDKQRLDMLKLALEDYKDIYGLKNGIEILVSDIELNAGGISYTYNTVATFRQKYSIRNRLGIIIGDDHIKLLKKWFNYEKLKAEVEFIICPRENDEALWSLLDNDLQYLRIKPEKIAVENSTEIRNNLDKSKNYLSGRVRDYVRKHNLYS